MMSRMTGRIPYSIATSCLWSYRRSDLDLHRDRKLIITQVLNYGDWKALQWLYRIFPEREIRKAVEHPSRGLWLKQVLNFWCLMLNVHLPKQIFKKSVINL